MGAPFFALIYSSPLVTCGLQGKGFISSRDGVRRWLANRAALLRARRGGKARSAPYSHDDGTAIRSRRSFRRWGPRGVDWSSIMRRTGGRRRAGPQWCGSSIDLPENLADERDARAKPPSRLAARNEARRGAASQPVGRPLRGLPNQVAAFGVRAVPPIQSWSTLRSARNRSCSPGPGRAVDTSLTDAQDKGPSITAKPLFYLVALQGFEPRTCGL